MLKVLFKILFKLDKWKLVSPAPQEANNCVMIAAPHTSNWDFVYAINALYQLDLNPRFTIKKDFNIPILGRWISDLGAIWIDRKSVKKQGITAYMALLFDNSSEPLTVVVTPEGTRSKNKKWRTGFYHAAVKSGVPICLSYMDYKKHETGVGLCFLPSGVIEDDMKIIMDFYANISGKFPENFSLDERFA